MIFKPSSGMFGSTLLIALSSMHANSDLTFIGAIVAAVALAAAITMRDAGK